MSISDLDDLAVLGGPPAVRRPLPHEEWPPAAEDDELWELAAQRNRDISIRGSAGPIRELEERFLQFLDGGSRWAVTFNSGTSALLAGYFALGVEEGAEVIGPALTYHAALSPAYLLGARVVLADIDAATRCIDPASAEARISERTKVLVAVHQWGHPCDMDAVMRLAEKYDLAVLEDCSHAHGSRYRGRPCGTFGDAAVFSLQANKAVFAGEGGILVTDSDRVHDRAVLFGHYRDRSRDEVVDEDLRRYWVTGFGQKLRMSPFNAIVAKHSLARFPERRAARHAALNHLRDRLRDVDYLQVPESADDVDMGAWYGFKPLFVPERLPGIDRDSLVRILRAEGLEIAVPSAPHLADLPLFSGQANALFPAVAQEANHPDAAPVARDVESRALSLPTFTEWPGDRELIDGYVEAFLKVGRNREALADRARPAAAGVSDR